MKTRVNENWQRLKTAGATLTLIGIAFGCSSESGSMNGVPVAGGSPSGTVAPSGSGTVPGAGTGVAPGASAPAGTNPAPGGSATGVPGEPGPGPGGEPAPGGEQQVPCLGEETLASKRLVRLTFNQVANALGDLLGAPLADQVRTDFELPSPLARTFPPLNNPREGSVVIDAQWQTGDAIAQEAGRFVAENFATVTQCGDAPTEECARSFAGDFAARAFRRPLEGDELDTLLGVFDSVLQAGGSIQEATQYAVYGALSAPQFLYRTEFGADVASAGALTPYETASMLSFFIADGPPDEELLAAAAQNALSTPDQIAAQADRLLQTPEARSNLQAAMYSYFGIDTLSTIVIDPGVAPLFNEGLRNSMMRETELFINNTLWNGVVPDLLLSRESFINQGLANLYGIEFPPPGAEMDADGFARVTLPENRSGILTQPGYLTTRSSPEEPSVVRRGLLVNASLLCAENPVFPEAQADEIDEVIASLTGLTPREQADFRMSTPECMGCHMIFDPYGVGLENLDVIGAYRENYELEMENGSHSLVPIDASVALPPAAGGATVTTPAEMAAELAASGAFTTCVAKNLIAYSLAEASTISARSCATRRVSEAFATTDQTFSSLVREVAKSTTFINRNAGAAQ